jgi:hypothetical protein
MSLAHINDPLHRSLDLDRGEVAGLPQVDQKVVASDVQHIDARHSRDLLDGVETGRALDHADDQRLSVENLDGL